MNSPFLKEDLSIICEELERLHFEEQTILVTGATGLISSIIIKAIHEYNNNHYRKIRVIGMARNPYKVSDIYDEELLSDNTISFVYQDICNPFRSEGCDYIIHTANSTNSKQFMTIPVEVIDSIYVGSRNMLGFAKKTEAQGIVYLSSMEVFGRIDSDRRVSENELGYLDIQNVRSCYSEGKRLVECLCKAFAEEYGVPVRVARLAQTFGAGVFKNENRVFAQFARSALKGENIVLHTRGTSTGNYIYTRDAIKAILLLLHKGNIGDVYTVVNEETTMTIYEMANLVANCFSRGKSQVAFDISQDNQYGYAPETKLRLSSAKLRGLGWRAEVGIREMYERMLPDLL